MIKDPGVSCFTQSVSCHVLYRQKNNIYTKKGINSTINHVKG